MANRYGYGSESYALEFRDLQATTLSIDKNGQFALLAGRKYLAVLSLDDEAQEKLLVRVPYGGKYDISSTSWCRGQDDNLAKSVAIACSQRCDIFELTDSAELRCAVRLKGHTRVITDLDWSSITPTLLASSSFDSFVHIWDVRIKNNSSEDKPQFSLSALDGASQVRWNPYVEDLLASCDGGHVKIWDLRKPSTPSEYIAAHASKINGLEWADSETVITAAQDCTVKFSRLASDNSITKTKSHGPAYVLSLTAPVWRARPAPFGRGVITQCVPILRRESGLLSLWDWKRFASPVYTFQAYDIIEFAWRKTQSYDLITWSRDQTLRIWTLPKEIVEICGGDEGGVIYPSMSGSHEGPSFLDGGIDLTEEESPSSSPPSASTPIPKIRKGSTLERRSRKSSSPSPLNRREFLRTEFEKVELEKPDTVNFDQVEVEKGLLRFSWNSKQSGDSKIRGVTAGILASFPAGYPATAPTFLVTNASSEVDKNQVVKMLKNVAQQFSKNGEQCLGKCVEQFHLIMSSIKTLDDTEQGFFAGARGVSNVPFPRTSGARFCAVGLLVCFGRPSYLKRVKSNCDSGTPRALGSLGPYLSQVALENEDTRYRRGHRRPEKKRAGLVTLFDVSPLLPFNLKLAEGYKHLVSSPGERRIACDVNRTVANAQQKPLVANLWQACSIVASFAHPEKKEEETTPITAINDIEDEDESNWMSHHPLGSELVHSMIAHCAMYGDVQTAATIACLFTSQQHLPSVSAADLQQFRNNHGTTKPPQGHRQTHPGSGSPYHTVHASDTSQHHQHQSFMINPQTAENFFRQQRSNSWSDSIDDMKMMQMLQAAGGVYESGGDYYGQVYSMGHTKSHHHQGTISESHSNGNFGHLYGGVPEDVAKSLSLFPLTKGVVLDCSFNREYDKYKKSYAELLYRWGLLQQRAQILKNLTEISETTMVARMGVDFSTVCKNCRKQATGPYCHHCKKVALVCSICHTPTKGLCSFCPLCGHGGHSDHMKHWFSAKKICPTGCGCNCVVESTSK